MSRRVLGTIAIASFLCLTLLFVRGSSGSNPPSGTVSPGSPRVTWSGGPFLVSNPTNCDLASATCDTFALTIDPPAGDFAVTIRVDAGSNNNDIDLFVRRPDGSTAGSSTTETGVEQVVLVNPPAGTFTVVVQPFLVVPGATYVGVAALGDVPLEAQAKGFHGVRVGPNFAGIPSSSRAPAPGPPLRVSFDPVGRRAAEPTVGVTSRNTAFYAAADFDSEVGAEGVTRLARTVVMRSADKGRSWQPASPPLLLLDETTEPPMSLDPMVHVDPDTGRIFSIDLYVGCSWLIFSDDEGATWERNVLACGQPVNDHHTIVTAPPPPGVTTSGYPNVVSYCFNRVSDSSCGRSLDGGRTFSAAGTAFTGVDPDAGTFCGGLHGHLAGDNAGRVFLPKGHCAFPWVAISEDGGITWTRVQIARHTPMADHEVSLAVDADDNIYALWQDGFFRLPFLSVSTDHGRTWSTPLMVAPSGVHEVNFPTIVAGDTGRIAFTFPGTTVNDRSDDTRPWNAYVVVSTNALDDNPLFVWTTGNSPADPVHRGNCGPGRCGGMFDFLDIQTSPADDAVWATTVDTCVNACVTDANAGTISPGEGISMRQTKGRLLFERK